MQPNLMPPKRAV